MICAKHPPGVTQPAHRRSVPAMRTSVHRGGRASGGAARQVLTATGCPLGCTRARTGCALRSDSAVQVPQERPHFRQEFADKHLARCDDGLCRAPPRPTQLAPALRYRPPRPRARGSKRSSPRNMAWIHPQSRHATLGAPCISGQWGDYRARTGGRAKSQAHGCETYGTLGGRDPHRRWPGRGQPCPRESTKLVNRLVSAIAVRLELARSRDVADFVERVAAHEAQPDSDRAVVRHLWASVRGGPVSRTGLGLPAPPWQARRCVVVRSRFPSGPLHAHPGPCLAAPALQRPDLPMPRATLWPVLRGRARRWAPSIAVLLAVGSAAKRAPRLQRSHPCNSFYPGANRYPATS